MDSFCQAVCFGISSACAELNACGLKELALKQTCFPFLQLAPAATSWHSDKLKLKQIGLPLASLPTAPLIPLGA